MKRSTDLEKNPIIDLMGRKAPELPIRTTTKILTQTEGRGLKQNTRGNSRLVEAVMFGYPWVQRWGDAYVQNMLDDMMSLAIGMDGEGRREQIQALEAGGQVPEAYYNGGKVGGPEGYKDTAYVRGNVREEE